MANEVSYATALSTGGRVASVLSPLLHTLLYDPTGLRAYADFKPFVAGGSDTMNVARYTRGAAMAAASSETSGGFSNADLVTTNYNLTPARYGMVRQATDLFKLTGGALNIEVLLSILAESLDLTITDLLCALFPSLAGTAGTSGVNLSVDNWFDAIYYLNLKNNVGEGLVSVLHAQQVNDLTASVRGEAGAMQYRADAQGMLGPKGVGFVGEFAGVKIVQSDSVSSDGSDRRGAMFAPGCFVYTLGPVDVGVQVNPADIVVATPEMFVERNRDAANAMTSYVVNAYPAVAEQEDLRGIKIVTDA